MNHHSFSARYALVALGALLLAGNALADPMQFADAGPAMRAGFVPLDAVRAGRPPMQTRSMLASKPVALAKPNSQLAPSGHFLPLTHAQARPIPLQQRATAIPLRPATIAAAAKPAAPATDEADDDEDEHEESGNAMALFHGSEGRVSSNKLRPDSAKTVKQSWPLPSKAEQHISSGFGMRKDPFTGAPEFHEGVDLAAAAGTPVLASADGVIETAGHGHGFGNYVVIRHADGSQSLYGHMRKETVHEGEDVRRGQKIGEVGSTGRSTAAHLHYQIEKNGHAVNPMLAMSAPFIGVASR